MQIKPTILKTAFITALLTAMFISGCNRRSPDADQASIGAGNSATDTATASRADTSGSTSSGSSGSSDSSGASDTGTASKVGGAVDDSVVTTKVKAAYLADTDIKGLDISVDTNKGEVTLTGAVNNQTQIDRAQKIAKGIEGVKAVHNKLTIKK
ncbi:MAG TPA: BON domain-containing protein [Burkholderiaceae bacterium]|nr:BON domain-containing protein [Burkholderiaceae bacterium]